MREKTHLSALIFILQAVIYRCYGSTLLQNNNIGLKNAISSMEKAIDFYSVNFAKVNLDSIYGVRIAEGALYKALHSSKLRSLSPNIQKKIKNLYIRTAKVAEKGYRHLKTQKIVYFLKFKPVIRKKWSLFLQPYWSVAGQKVIPKKNDKVTKSKLCERLTDICMTNMMGTNIFGKRKKCNLPKKCWEYMTITNTNRYTLTHQAIYFLIAKDQGCGKEVIAKMGNETAVEKYIRYLAARMYFELKKEIIKGRFVKESDKDLFAEQVLFCQILGAVECFNLKYLEMITHWQDETGCWKTSETKSNDYENENAFDENEAKEQLLNYGMGNMDEDLGNGRSEGNEDDVVEEDDIIAEEDHGDEIKTPEDNENVINDELSCENDDDDRKTEIGDEDHVLSTSRLHSERMSAEKVLSNGCSSHFSGVATGVVGNFFVYWFLNTHNSKTAKDTGI